MSLKLINNNMVYPSHKKASVKRWEHINNFINSNNYKTKINLQKRSTIIIKN